MRVLPFRTPAEIESALDEITDWLRQDRLIAYPTETVYGFGGAVTPAAIGRLRALKRREEGKPFLILIKDGVRPGEVVGPEWMDVEWPDAAHTLASRFWPGPLTLVIQTIRDGPLDALLAEDGTAALRATSHEGVQSIIRALGGPITSSSANAPHEPAARNADEAQAALKAIGADDVLVLDGGTLAESPPSTIVAFDAVGARVIRAGAIGVADLNARLRGTGIDVR